MTTYPLLQSQLGIFISWEVEPSTTGYNLPSYTIFTRHIKADVLASALREVIDSHPELRTRFVSGPHGEPRQYSDAAMSIPISRLSMSEEEAKSHIANGFVRPFEPYGAKPLCRFEIIETPEHIYFLCDFHHTIADGITIARNFMGRDLPKAYEKRIKPTDRPTPNPSPREGSRGKPSPQGGTERDVHHPKGGPKRTLIPPRGDQGGLFPLSMYDYAVAEQTDFGSASYLAAKQYYAQRFGNVAFTNLSAEVSDPWGAWLTASERVDGKAVDDWCQRNSISPGDLFLAAFSVILARLSGESRVAFFSLNHGRFTRRVADAYGMFVRSVPIMADVEAGAGIRQFVGSFRSQLIASVRHHSYPFSHFCRDHNVVPHVTFGFQSSSIIEYNNFDGELGHGTQLHQGRVKNDLGCTVYVVQGGYELRFDSSEAYNSKARLQMMARALKSVIEGITSDESTTLGELSLTTADEQRQLISLGSTLPIPYDAAISTLQLILRQADSTPDNTAISDGTLTLSYRQLAEQARLRASQLAESGITEGMVVPLTAVPSCSFVADILAIWLLGAAYMPISPDEPKPRRRKMMADIKGKRVSAAYVIYTSGSTGEPNGVVVSHRALLNLVHFIRHEWQLSAHSRIACHASLTFDASVEDLFPVLTVGGTLYMVHEEVRRNVPQLEQFINQHHITGGCYTTSLGLKLAERGNIRPDYICLGGERLTRCPLSPISKIINTYGPTEFTVDATYHRIDPSRSYKEVPIGRPVAGCAAYIVDRDGQLLPRGAVGELWLAGPQMASGYLGNPKLTTERFVRAAFTGNTMYRTGDLARWNERGELEFVGRRDAQLKLRGYRIEPTEVERVLMQVTQVTGVAVSMASRDGESVLCAFYTAGEELQPTILFNHAKAHLPRYMVPSAWQQMERLPLSSSGKVDRRRLPTIAPPPLQHYTEPENDEQRLWCDVMATVLGADRIGIDDDFFLAGGSSLQVASVQIEAAKRGRKLTYAQLFNNPTPRQLAETHPQPLPKGGGHGKNPPSGPPQGRGGKKLSSFSIPLATPPSLGEGLGVGFPLLITGATGLLGAHVAEWLLRNTDRTVYCLVRKKGPAAAERLRQSMIYYFGEEFYSTYADRLKAVEGDICQLPTGNGLPRVATVVHCAADVRQYATGDSIQQANVGGTVAVADYCRSIGARLIHISTTSVATGVMGQGARGKGQEDSDTCLTRENKGQEDSDTCLSQVEKLSSCPLPPSPRPLSQYVESKIEAEKVVCEAAEAGLQATIVRVGNLMPRFSDGRFQPNMGENGFFMALRALSAMGCYPETLGQMAVDLSPVDLVAADIGRIATNTRSIPPRGDTGGPQTIVLCHPQPPQLGAIAKVFAAIGLSLRPVASDVFTSEMQERLSVSTLRTTILPLVMLMEQWQQVPISQTNTLKISHTTNPQPHKTANPQPQKTSKRATSEALSAANWPALDEEYLKKVVRLLVQ